MQTFDDVNVTVLTQSGAQDDESQMWEHFYLSICLQYLRYIYLHPEISLYDYFP